MHMRKTHSMPVFEDALTSDTFSTVKAVSWPLDEILTAGNG